MKDCIVLANEDLELPIKNESSVLELLLNNKVDIDHSCGGFATCGTCRVFVKSDLKSLEPRNEIEQERADDLSFEEHERLACQLQPRSGLIIEVPT